MTPNIDQAERFKIISQRINRGQDSYAGRQDAWHKLGAVSGEFQTWREMIKVAGADFHVVKRQLQFAGKDVPSWATFKRLVSDVAEEEKNLTFLGTVGEDYTVIQHTEGFELLDTLVNSIDGAHYETMGTLDYGRIVWGQVDPNIQIRVGDDTSDVFLSFLTSHDGSKAFDIYETGVRQVCRNTVRIGSLKRLAASLRVKHTKNSQKRIDNLKVEIDEIRNVAMTMQERLNYLANRKVTKVSLTKIMDKLFPKKQTEEGEESSTRRDNILAEILAIYDANDGDQFPEQRGTAYNLLNAVTNYTDHVRSSKGDMRSESALFESGDKMKTTALQLIMEEAEEMPPIRQAIEVQDWKQLLSN